MNMLSDPEENRLIAALTERDRRRWLPQLESVEARRLGQAHFSSPAHAEPCLLSDDGHRLAAVCHGKRCLSRESHRRQRRPRRHFALHGGRVGLRSVRTAGHAYRLASQAIKDEVNARRCHLLLRYTQALITQMSQSTATGCTRSTARCRWLLLGLARLQSNELGDDPGTDRQHARRCAARA